jgi:3-dehydroquinate synthase class II
MTKPAKVALKDLEIGADSGDLISSAMSELSELSNIVRALREIGESLKAIEKHLGGEAPKRR